MRLLKLFAANLAAMFLVVITVAFLVAVYICIPVWGPAICSVLVVLLVAVLLTITDMRDEP